MAGSRCAQRLLQAVLVCPVSPILPVDSPRNRYLRAIVRGKVTREELAAFGVEFSVTAIEPHSEEWNFYIKMLFGKDLPTVDAATGHSTFRVGTIVLYLEYLDNSKQFESAGHAFGKGAEAFF